MGANTMNEKLKRFRIVIILIMILLTFRAVHLQVLSGKYYFQLSEGNRTSNRPINAPRGKIIDRNGNILVSNKLSYNLYLLPNEIPPEISLDTILKNISKYTNLEFEKLKNNYEMDNEKESFSSVLLKRNIKAQTLVRIKENSDELPGVLVKESSIRDYVYDDTAAHILGYVGQITRERLKTLHEAGYENYDGRDIVGITGLEKEYETLLNGKEGIEQIEVNSVGEKVRTLGVKSPSPGNDLVLNLDYSLQRETRALLGRKFYEMRRAAKKDEEKTPPTGAGAIVMDVETGKIRSMVSIPTFDLNDFAGGVSNQKYSKLLNNPLKPMLNRLTMSAIPPGSIFKLVTGTAAINHLGIDGDTQFTDENGKFYIPNWSRPFKNWYNRGEGKLDFTKAIGRSNNVVFYELGYRLYEKYRGKKLIETARKYGLGQKTGIDLPSEKKGLVPDREWKQETFDGAGWYPGDSVNLSIGQGGLLTTPLQLVNMVNTIANDGVMYHPFLVDKIVDPEGDVVKDIKPKITKELPFAKKTYDILKEGMQEVTDANYGRTMGTAARVFKDFPVTVAGKTGTAQTGRSNHGWFVGFAPVDDPEVIVLVFLENGESSSNTLPVAKGIFKHYFGYDRHEEIISYSTIRKHYTDDEADDFIDYLNSVFSDE